MSICILVYVPTQYRNGFFVLGPSPISQACIDTDSIGLVVLDWCNKCTMIIWVLVTDMPEAQAGLASLTEHTVLIRP